MSRNPALEEEEREKQRLVMLQKQYMKEKVIPAEQAMILAMGVVAEEKKAREKAKKEEEERVKVKKEKVLKENELEEKLVLVEEMNTTQKGMFAKKGVDVDSVNVETVTVLLEEEKDGNNKGNGDTLYREQQGEKGEEKGEEDVAMKELPQVLEAIEETEEEMKERERIEREQADAMNILLGLTSPGLASPVRQEQGDDDGITGHKEEGEKESVGEGSELKTESRSDPENGGGSSSSQPEAGGLTPMAHTIPSSTSPASSTPSASSSFSPSSSSSSLPKPKVSFPCPPRFDDVDGLGYIIPLHPDLDNEEETTHARNESINSNINNNINKTNENVGVIEYKGVPVESISSSSLSLSLHDDIQRYFSSTLSSPPSTSTVTLPSPHCLTHWTQALHPSDITTAAYESLLLSSPYLSDLMYTATTLTSSSSSSSSASSSASSDIADVIISDAFDLSTLSSLEEAWRGQCQISSPHLHFLLRCLYTPLLTLPAKVSQSPHTLLLSVPTTRVTDNVNDKVTDAGDDDNDDDDDDGDDDEMDDSIAFASAVRLAAAKSNNTNPKTSSSSSSIASSSSSTSPVPCSYLCVPLSLDQSSSSSPSPSPTFIPLPFLHTIDYRVAILSECHPRLFSLPSPTDGLFLLGGSSSNNNNNYTIAQKAMITDADLRRYALSRSALWRCTVRQVAMILSAIQW